jgi:hypothetical protein
MQTDNRNEILHLISHKQYYQKIKKELLTKIQRREIVKLRRKKEFNDDEEYKPSREDLVSTGRAIIKSGGKVTKQFHLIIQNALKLFEFQAQMENLNFPEKRKELIQGLEKKRMQHQEVIRMMNAKYIEYLNKEFAVRKDSFVKPKANANGNNNQISMLLTLCLNLPNF